MKLFSIFFFFLLHSKNTLFYIVLLLVTFKRSKRLQEIQFFEKILTNILTIITRSYIDSSQKKKKEIDILSMRYAIITVKKTKRLSGENSIFNEEQTFLRVTLQLTSISRIRRNTKNA